MVPAAREDRAVNHRPTLAGRQFAQGLDRQAPACRRDRAVSPTPRAIGTAVRGPPPVPAQVLAGIAASVSPLACWSYDPVPSEHALPFPAAGKRGRQMPRKTDGRPGARSEGDRTTAALAPAAQKISKKSCINPVCPGFLLQRTKRCRIGRLTTLPNVKLPRPATL
jgi:hypothetical protein